MNDLITQVKRNRRFIVYIKSTIRCSKCGDTFNLQFHHCGESHKKEMSISKMVRKYPNIEDILRELNKCAILCERCHKGIHYGGEQDNTLPRDWNAVYSQFIEVDKWKILII